MEGSQMEKLGQGRAWDDKIGGAMHLICISHATECELAGLQCIGEGVPTLHMSSGWILTWTVLRPATARCLPVLGSN